MVGKVKGDERVGERSNGDPQNRCGWKSPEPFPDRWAARNCAYRDLKQRTFTTPTQQGHVGASGIQQE